MISSAAYDALSNGMTTSDIHVLVESPRIRENSEKRRLLEYASIVVVEAVPVNTNQSFVIEQNPDRFEQFELHEGARWNPIIWPSGFTILKQCLEKSYKRVCRSLPLLLKTPFHS